MESMQVPSANPQHRDQPTRKRRAHIKSRKGCGNCKLRRVKCDETRPHCKRCLSYNVSCTYDAKKASLDLCAEGAFQVDFSQKSPQSQTLVKTHSSPKGTLVSMNAIVLKMLNNTLEAEYSSTRPFVGPWACTEKDLELFQRFQQRTVMTVGTGRAAQAYRDHLGPMAFRYPFLLRITLSLVLMHDAYLLSTSTSPNPSLTAALTHASLQHWNTATHLFNVVLSRPIAPESRDALWATAALIGTNVFAYVEAPVDDVSQAWPLKPADPNDLDWLRLTDGKKAIWKIAQPAREDSIWSYAAREHAFEHAYPEDTCSPFSAVPADLKRLFGIDDDSTLQNNPYYLPALILVRLPDKGPPRRENLLHYLHFLAYMTPGYKDLLERKDPRALLLLRWWFKLVEESELWWLKKRAVVEGRAVQVWLESYWKHGDVPGFRGLDDGCGCEAQNGETSWGWAHLKDFETWGVFLRSRD